MSEVVIYIVIFSIIVLLLLVFIIKSIVSPKKFSAVEKAIALGKYSQAVKLAKKLFAEIFLYSHIAHAKSGAIYLVNITRTYAFMSSAYL